MLDILYIERLIDRNFFTFCELIDWRSYECCSSVVIREVCVGGEIAFGRGMGVSSECVDCRCISWIELSSSG